MNANLVKKVDKVLEKLGEVIRGKRVADYSAQYIMATDIIKKGSKCITSVFYY
jgi:hypothetical protein